MSRRVSRVGKSAIHEMTRLSRDVEDVAFLSWAKPTGSYLMFPRIFLDEGRDSAAFCKKLPRF